MLSFHNYANTIKNEACTIFFSQQCELWLPIHWLAVQEHSKWSCCPFNAPVSFSYTSINWNICASFSWLVINLMEQSSAPLHGSICLLFWDRNPPLLVNYLKVKSIQIVKMVLTTNEPQCQFYMCEYVFRLKSQAVQTNRKQVWKGPERKIIVSYKRKPPDKKTFWAIVCVFTIGGKLQVLVTRRQDTGRGYGKVWVQGLINVVALYSIWNYLYVIVGASE